jgi:predicted esterase
MKKNIHSVIFIILFVLILLSYSVFQSGCKDNITTVTSSSELNLTTCDNFGAQPIRTVYPVTLPLAAEDGELLSWQQGSVIRYACLNYPNQADSQNYSWPMIVYIHGSLVTPMSLYTIGRKLFNMRDDYILSGNDSIRGFILLSPEGRIAKPWTGSGPETGEGFHWDEWYRNPDENLDALAIDHFIDEVVSTGKVDTSRIYVFGWSNGAYMTVLYSTWRSSRIAAMGQYAGGNPWSRTPCPVEMSYTRQVPLILLRNLCDALVPCDSTNIWISTLESLNWPFEHYNLDAAGEIVGQNEPCSTDPGCSKDLGLGIHFRWPGQEGLDRILEFFKHHPLTLKKL